jgi:hypothetical protein
LTLGHVPDVLNALSIPVEPAMRPAPSVFLQKALSIAGDLWIYTKAERSRRINAALEAFVNKGVYLPGLDAGGNARSPGTQTPTDRGEHGTKRMTIMNEQQRRQGENTFQGHLDANDKVRRLAYCFDPDSTWGTPGDVLRPGPDHQMMPNGKVKLPGPPA